MGRQRRLRPASHPCPVRASDPVRGTRRRGPNVDREPLRFRRIRAEEWRAYRTLRLRSLSTDPLAFGSTRAREGSLPDPHWQERVRAGARSREASLWVAVGGDGTLRGTASLVRLRGWHLFGMWLDPRWRGRGAGGRLLDRALAWLARHDPGAPVRLDVNPRQEAAVALYRSRGFRRTGRSEPLEHTPSEPLIEMLLRPRP